MTEIVKELSPKRLVIIGDSGTGKTTIVTAFAETHPGTKPTPKPADPAAAEAIQQKADAKKAKNSEIVEAKRKGYSSSEDEDSDVDDPKLLEEIDALLVYSSFNHNDSNHELAIWDAKTNTDFKENRAAVYSKADALILMYSIDVRKTFKNVGKKWKSHLKKHLKRNPNCPIILVGNKMDLRVKANEDDESDEDEVRTTVSTNEGKRLAKKIGAQEFFECSAVNKEGIFEIFAKAATITYQPPADSKCLVS